MDPPKNIADLEAVLRARKRLVGSLEWKPQHRGAAANVRGARLNLVAALDTGGVTLEAVSFVAAATKSEPDRAVTMQLCVLYGGKRRPFTRVDWRGAPHTNRYPPQSPLHMRSLDETHIHRLGDNAILGWPEIVAADQDLPIADATPPLADYRTLVAYIRGRVCHRECERDQRAAVGAVAFKPVMPIVGHAAIGGLVRARTTPSRTEIVLPVLYPNGSHVVVFVYPEGDTFTVSDEGRAAAEAEMAGVHPRFFSAIANREAARVGATCDSRAFFFLRVAADRLVAAITVLAELARTSVALALEKLAERRPSRLEERLLDHLEHAFGGTNVHPHADVVGASNVAHRLNALVTFGGRRVVFDMFSDHHVSFNSTVSKFLDISHSEDAPARVGVTKVRAKLGDRLSLIGSVAKVIELDAVDDVYRRAAA